MARGCGETQAPNPPHTPTVSADTEVVGGDGQHHSHLGPGSRLLLPPTHLHQPHHLQVSPLGVRLAGGGVLSSSFLLTSGCLPPWPVQGFPLRLLSFPPQDWGHVWEASFWGGPLQRLWGGFLCPLAVALGEGPYGVTLGRRLAVSLPVSLGEEVWVCLWRIPPPLAPSGLSLCLLLGARRSEEESIPKDLAFDMDCGVNGEGPAG